MLNKLEKTYSMLLNSFKFAISPFKKALVVTECKVHMFINVQALEIIKNDNFEDAYTFFSDYISQINEGAVWADQNFRSMGHFYNPYIGIGLYGNRNAVSLAVEYYSKALAHWKYGDIDKSMFYLGAAVHLVQDVAVPQHANIRLLDNHRRYENYIRRNYKRAQEFLADEKGYYYMHSISEAVKCNARCAIKIYSKLKYIKNEDKRFHVITKFVLPLAQKSTAGCFIMFYRDVVKPDLKNKSNPNHE
jgi:phospholipase C